LTDKLDILSLRTVGVGYEKKQVLFDIDLVVKVGKITAIIGPNGAGKSTILKAAHGLLPLWKGAVFFENSSLNGIGPDMRIRKGITLCPQGRRVFGELTVRENLELGGIHLPPRETIARVAEALETFKLLVPHLKQIAGTLSGGEQQMVAIARAIVSKPKLLMLDEPSLGLSPNILDDVFKKIVEINCAQNITILIVEQKVHKVLAIADHVYSLKLGKVAFSGHPGDLITDIEMLRKLFL
jgi:branched-chain amino acid transport system ATP-binding protein